MHAQLQPSRSKSFLPVPTIRLQRKAAVEASLPNHSFTRGSRVPAIAQEVVRFPGQPLDLATRAFFEPRFGHDFGNVRVHTDASAAESARAMNAIAYAVGPSIALPSDRYEPASVEGRKLLAHELTHVLQQTAASGGNASEEAAEAEANRNAVASAGNGPLAVRLAAPGKVIQRQPAAAKVDSPAALSDLEKVVHAANRARRDSSNATSVMINGSEIVYRLVHEFLPDYDSKISGVGYGANLKKISVVADKGSVDIKVGNDFIFGTNEKTLEVRARELETAILEKLPRAPISVETTFGYDIPGLGPEMKDKVEQRIKVRDAQGAINLIVKYGGGAGGSNIDTKLLTGGKMEWDPTIEAEDAVHDMSSWDYLNNKAEPAKVRVGPKAFSSVPYLYSVIMHEYQHVLWNQTLENQTIGRESHEDGRQGGGKFTSEVEAYAYELLNAKESGLSQIPEKIAGVWSNLNDEFWTLDQPTRTKMLPKVQKALEEAKRLVRGSQVMLVPFARPAAR